MISGTAVVGANVEAHGRNISARSIVHAGPNANWCNAGTVHIVRGLTQLDLGPATWQLERDVQGLLGRIGTANLLVVVWASLSTLGFGLATVFVTMLWMDWTRRRRRTVHPATFPSWRIALGPMMHAVHLDKARHSTLDEVALGTVGMGALG
jgi:hypothetical protein